MTRNETEVALRATRTFSPSSMAFSGLLLPKDLCVK